MKNTAEIKKENQRRIWEILRDGLPHTKQEAARIARFWERRKDPEKWEGLLWHIY